ncbi:MAG: alpha-amylase family glycosyl hydrolase [Promethearchaeota archaeon]
MEKSWPENPTVLEINTWPWLDALSRAHGEDIGLENVPERVIDDIAMKFDAIWLMGVWMRSPGGARIAANHPGLQGDFREALHDYTPGDVTGSPYAVKDYLIEPKIGGHEGFIAISDALRSRGVRLILDFVPNHVAVDHPWARLHPEYFIHGTRDNLDNSPDYYIEVSGSVIAHGRDPFFPPWTDTLQLNAFSRAYRSAAINTLSLMAKHCDGVRCDMAMLLSTGVFQRTWGYRAGEPPGVEFWREVISAVKARTPDFKFFGEVYWDMEWELQQQGFDFCYDKRLYDRLLHDSPGSIRGHLHAELSYQSKLIRFIENHDEPRAVTSLGREKSMAAAAIILGLPGARLVHDGQQEGRRIKLPVQLGRFPDEPVDAGIVKYYDWLLDAWHLNCNRGGKWMLRATRGIPGNDPEQNPVIAYSWRQAGRESITVVNYSGMRFKILLPSSQFKTNGWELADKWWFSERSIGGKTTVVWNSARNPNISLDLDPWEVKFLDLLPFK